LEQRRRIIMTTIAASIDNKKTKVKRLKEDRFCVFFAFLLSGFYFVVGLFLKNILSSSLKRFISPRILSLYSN